MAQNLLSWALIDYKTAAKDDNRLLIFCHCQFSWTLLYRRRITWNVLNQNFCLIDRETLLSEAKNRLHKYVHLLIYICGLACFFAPLTLVYIDAVWVFRDCVTPAARESWCWSVQWQVWISTAKLLCPRIISYCSLRHIRRQCCKHRDTQWLIFINGLKVQEGCFS